MTLLVQPLNKCECFNYPAIVAQEKADRAPGVETLAAGSLSQRRLQLVMLDGASFIFRLENNFKNEFCIDPGGLLPRGPRIAHVNLTRAPLCSPTAPS